MRKVKQLKNYSFSVFMMEAIKTSTKHNTRCIKYTQTAVTNEKGKRETTFYEPHRLLSITAEINYYFQATLLELVKLVLCDTVITSKTGFK